MTLAETFFNQEVFLAVLPLLIKGLGMTLLLGVTCIVLGSLGGLVVCLARLYAPAPIRILAIAYIDIFRAVPALVVLTMIYYALPFVGIRLSGFVSAALGLSLVLSAFTAEVCRAGIEAVPKGQFEAASALGLHIILILRKVVLPQALRVAIPPTTSNWVSVIKDTSLASVVAIPELLKQATDAQALMANPTPILAAALIYLVLLWPLVRLIGYLEKRSRAAKER
ncbi:amino acid ABC transporter membrane protein, PAAT family [Rhizobiales bacterium GAS191]|nr:amino acid ABC transporter membrane protein, PAAT family [Rhizobiales bacterium GAS113]SED32442.1 amino acid ABC transporter membrane protein, PAAT family [Rhizobiales bacterium GAS188]SEE96497.1 amino acid ABC transporter membrane protein, PAAT family [Rhizobiales bacterium GAS191]